MRVQGIWRQSIALNRDGYSVDIIDQTLLPFEISWKNLRSVEDCYNAIAVMQVRGAPLIGITALYGLCLALRENANDESMHAAIEKLLSARPTAVNLRWALLKARDTVQAMPEKQRVEHAYALAARLWQQDIDSNRQIGQHGLGLIRNLAEHKKRQVNLLTHCNAGWLATVDWGTALSPIYQAHDAGIDVHVWVDETRPRNQGASLTLWELQQHGVPCTLIVDNAGGHLMQQAEVDACIVGSDRTTASGDVCNKIGTYLKALAAKDNDIPFWVALPTSTIDWQLDDGRYIPIEERAASEVLYIQGKNQRQQVDQLQLTIDQASAANPAFDVTPARLVSALITEKGVVEAKPEAIAGLK